MITVDGSPLSDEAHQESVRRRLLYIAAELKICSVGPIITSFAPIKRNCKNKKDRLQRLKNFKLFMKILNILAAGAGGNK